MTGHESEEDLLATIDELKAVRDVIQQAIDGGPHIIFQLAPLLGVVDDA